MFTIAVPEYPKLPLEPFSRDNKIAQPDVTGFNNYATSVEVEIVFWTFGIVRFSAEFCETLETRSDKDNVQATHEKWDMENRK